MGQLALLKMDGPTNVLVEVTHSFWDSICSAFSLVKGSVNVRDGARRRKKP